MAGEKKYKTEWSFSFDQLGKDIGEFVTNLGGGSEETIRQDEFSAALDGAASAQVRIDFSIGESRLHALTNLDNLIEADLTYVGDIRFVVTGEAEKSVILSQSAKPSDWARNIVGWIGSRGKLRWDIGLATGIPIALEVHGGVGEVKLDLTELDLTSFHLYGGTGEIEVRLPDRTDAYPAVIHSGLGELEISIPAHTTVDLNVRAGAGEVDITVGEGANVTARIDGGLGECQIHLPAGMEGRVEASTGIGDIRLNPAFRRISGGDNDFISKSGIWQTANYDDAASRLTLHYSGGVGELKIT
jgi:predicted membrane protein